MVWAGRVGEAWWYVDVLTKNPFFLWGGGGVFFYKLTRNPGLTKFIFSFFFFFFLGGGGGGGGGGGRLREGEG